MIKSSDKKFNSTYRILRVLANQDYLAIDYTHSQYIFSQCEYNEKNSQDLSFADLLINSQNKTKHIIQHKECIAIDEIKYNVFQVGKQEVVWTKNIDQKRLSQDKFINNFIRQAIINILGEILWLNNRHIAKMLNIRNFWLFDGHLSLILMPRKNKQRFSLKRNENKRSFSQDCSAIPAVIQKQMDVIKKFADVIWQILEQTPFTLQLHKQSYMPAKQLLIKMISKRLSYEDILLELKGLDQFMIKSRIVKPFYLKSFEKGPMVQRRHTLEPSLFNRSQFTKRQQSQKISQKIKFKGETQPLIKGYKNLTQNKQQSKSFIQLNQATTDKKPTYHFSLPSRVSQKQTNFVNNQKLKPLLVSRNRTITKFDNEKERKKYLNWMKDQRWNLNLAQKINNRSLIAKEKFQQTFSNSPQISKIPNSQQLNLRLFSKALKFRVQKKYYKQAQTEISSNNEQQIPIYKRSQLIINNDIFLKKQHENEATIQTCNDNEYGFKDTIIKLPKKMSSDSKEKIDNMLTNQKKKQINKVNQQLVVQVNRFQTPIKINNRKEQDPIVKHQHKTDVSVISTNNLFFNQSLDNVQQQYIEELNFYKLADHYTKQVSKKDTEKIKKQPIQASVNKKAKVKEESQSLHYPKQERKSIKFKKSQFEDVNTADIETINIFQNNSKPINPKLQSFSKQKQHEKIHKEEIIKKTNPLLYNDLSVAIREFLTMINILGDITVQCVKSKDKIKEFDWKKSVYFLYQRFYYQRGLFLKNLLENKQEIVRRHRKINSKSWQPWTKSEQRVILIDQITKQNVHISQTYNRFSKKVLEKSQLQPKIESFIKNRDFIIAKNQSNVRFLVSKYTVALIINEFDVVLDQQAKSPETITCILNCLFGLRVLAELDDKQTDEVPLVIEDYHQQNGNLQQKGEFVQHIYNIYYPQSEQKKQP